MLLVTFVKLIDQFHLSNFLAQCPTTKGTQKAPAFDLSRQNTLRVPKPLFLNPLKKMKP